MQLGAIVGKLRLADTRFGNRIAGAAELDAAQRATFQKDMAFVIPMADAASPNVYDNGINQTVTEVFAVVVVLASDSMQKDKTGLGAYDLLHNVRADIFKAILGWQMTDAESLISYRGGRLIDFDRAYLWYQFEFQVKIRIDNDDGVAQGDELLPTLEEIYADYVFTPSDDLPISEHLPVDGFTPDMKQSVKE